MVRHFRSRSMSGRRMPRAKRALAKREVSIIPVLFGPDEFFSFCREKKISPNRATAAAFASSRGAASYSTGL